MEKTPEPKVSFLHYLWAVWLAIHFLVFFLPAYPLFRLFLARERYYPLAHRLRRSWGRYILFMTGIRTEVEFETALDPDKVYLFAPNHSSYLDIPAITVMMPGYFAFMAKMELARIPLFGIFFRSIDIAVNRKSAFDAHRSFLEAGKKVDKGISLCLFPEGTIPPDAPKLGRFKDGPFRLAIEKGVEIVPVTLPDNYKRLPDKGGFYGSPGRMRMYVHRPISTTSLKSEDIDRLKQEVFSIIESKLVFYAHNR